MRRRKDLQKQVTSLAVHFATQHATTPAWLGPKKLAVSQCRTLQWGLLLHETQVHAESPSGHTGKAADTARSGL